MIAELNDSDTAKKIFDALPIEGSANVWGEEIYFSIPLEIDLASNCRVEPSTLDDGSILILSTTPLSIF